MRKAPEKSGAFRFLLKQTSNDSVLPFEANSKSMAEKSTLEKVKALFAKHKITSVKFNEVKFLAAETADGKSIYTNAEEWAKGVDCFEDEAGTKPCPDGNYTLKSGETVVVASGKVSEIQPAKEEMKEGEMMEALAAFSTKLDEVVAENTKLSTELADIKTKFSAAEKKVTDLTTENTKLKLAAVPDKGSEKEEVKHEAVKFGKQNTAAENILEEIKKMRKVA